MSPIALRRWLDSRRAAWASVDRMLHEPQQRVADVDEAWSLIDAYRALSRDLAITRRELPGTDLVAHLQRQLMQLHLRLHRAHEPVGERLRLLYGFEIPAQFRRMQRSLCIALLIFLCSAAATAALVSAYPELAGLVASEKMIDEVEQGRLWTDGMLNVLPSSLVSVGIISNNVVVSLMAFTFGALYGAGTLYILALNGMLLGGIFAYTAQHGLALRLLRFILPHGVVELSVILLAAAAGLTLGEALVRPGLRMRADALRAAVDDAGRLLFVVVPFLLLAGTIEAFVSPTDAFSLPLRAVIGLLGGFLLWAVVSGRAMRRWLDPTLLAKLPPGA